MRKIIPKLMVNNNVGHLVMWALVVSITILMYATIVTQDI